MQGWRCPEIDVGVVEFTVQESRAPHKMLLNTRIYPCSSRAGTRPFRLQLTGKVFVLNITMFLIYKDFIQILKKNTKIQTDKQAEDRNKVFILEDIPTVNKMLRENVHPHSNKEMKIEVFNRKKKTCW